MRYIKTLSSLFVVRQETSMRILLSCGWNARVFSILLDSWKSTFTFMSMHVLTCFLYLWKLYVNNFPRIFKTENDEVAIYWDNKHSLISIWFQQRSNFLRPKIIAVLAYNLIFSVSIKRPCTSFLIEYHVVSASSFKISYVHICCLLSMFLRWNIKDASDTYTHFYLHGEPLSPTYDNIKYNSLEIMNLEWTL